MDWESQQIKDAIGATPRSEQALFWRLMACFASRRLVEFVEATDAERFDVFLASAAANVKLRTTFQRSKGLSEILQRRASLVDALAGFSSAKDAALRTALGQARQAGFGK